MEVNIFQTLNTSQRRTSKNWFVSRKINNIITAMHYLDILLPSQQVITSYYTRTEHLLEFDHSFIKITFYSETLTVITSNGKCSPYLLVTSAWYVIYKIQ